MARKHVVQYFLEMQNQYMEMLDNVKDFKDLAAEGRISPEDYQGFLAEVELLKNNYERIAYIMMLLNKPQRDSKKESADTLSWYKALKGSSKEALLDENRDVLADLKEYIRKGRTFEND